MNIDLYAGDLDQALRAIIPLANTDPKAGRNYVQLAAHPGGDHLLIAATCRTATAVARVPLIDPDGDLFETVHIRVEDAKNLRAVFAPGPDEALNTRRISAPHGGQLTCTESSGLFHGPALTVDQVAPADHFPADLASATARHIRDSQALAAPVNVPTDVLKRFLPAGRAYGEPLTVTMLERNRVLVYIGANCVGIAQGSRGEGIDGWVDQQRHKWTNLFPGPTPAGVSA